MTEPTHARYSGESDARDQVVAQYDDMAHELATLGDQQAVIGADKLAHECREFAYVAWRAARGEHENRPPRTSVNCTCTSCLMYRMLADKSVPALERIAS